MPGSCLAPPLVHKQPLSVPSPPFAGVCPQQDVLLEQLSVLEHLQLVAAVKGVPGRSACKAAALEMAALVGLGG